MSGKQFLRSLISIGLLLSLGACAFDYFGSRKTGEPELPDDHGFFALNGVDEDDYIRLDGNRKWEVKTWKRRSNLSPDTRFIVYDPILARSGRQEDQPVTLQRVAWVRSSITATGDIAPPTKSTWATSNIREFMVPVTVRNLRSNPSAVLVTPTKPLAPGLYTIQNRVSSLGSGNARFGVQWNTIDRSQYSARHCVDHYAGGRPEYRQCSQQTVAMRRHVRWRGIHVYMVDPEIRVVDGRNVVVLNGVIVNQAKVARELPLLQAQLRDAKGRALTKWTFLPNKRRLEAGESTSFRSQTVQPAREVSKATVRLIDESEAHLQ